MRCKGLLVPREWPITAQSRKTQHLRMMLSGPWFTLISVLAMLHRLIARSNVHTTTPTQYSAVVCHCTPPQTSNTSQTNLPPGVETTGKREKPDKAAKYDTTESCTNTRPRSRCRVPGATWQDKQVGQELDLAPDDICLLIPSLLLLTCSTRAWSITRSTIHTYKQKTSHPVRCKPELSADDGRPEKGTDDINEYPSCTGVCYNCHKVSGRPLICSGRLLG